MITKNVSRHSQIPPGSQNHSCFRPGSFAPNDFVLLSLDFSSWQCLLCVLLCLRRKLQLVVLKFLIFLWSFCIYLWVVACKTPSQFWLVFHTELDPSIWRWGMGSGIYRQFDFSTLGMSKNPFPLFPLNVSDTTWILLLLIFGPNCSYFGVHEWYIVS